MSKMTGPQAHAVDKPRHEQRAERPPSWNIRFAVLRRGGGFRRLDDGRVMMVCVRW